MSRAYTVETLEELILRSDSVVVGRVDGPASSEPAHDEGEGGLMVSTFPFTVTENLEGKTPTDATIDVSVLPVRGMEGQIAVLKPGKTYAAFLEDQPAGRGTFHPRRRSRGLRGARRRIAAPHRVRARQVPQEDRLLGDLRQVIDPVSLLESDT
ncbi:hypothetical protein [Janibacter melonis]|uniref:hypothetical protein n=1 Tax=Janibacter melonis TaxID=262209 RepID=UPI0020956E7A|nr:hypothetical protein [Janibacter melonis]